MDYLKLLGEQIKKVRESQGKRKHQMFLDTNIQIHRVEAGEIAITVTTLKTICDYLQIPPFIIVERG